MPVGFIGFLFFFLILAMGFTHAPVFADPDTAWHIAAGDLIRLGGKIPDMDDWSFAPADGHWYNLSWLFDCGISLLFGVGGFSAIYGLTVTVFAGAVAAMAWHCGKQGAAPVAVLLASFLAAFVVSTGMLARPNMCSVVFAVWFYCSSARFRDSGNPKNMMILPVVMTLWVNLHGGFLIAFPILGIFLLEAWWEYRRKAAVWYLGIIALCLLATLVNPYKAEIYYGAYKSIAAKFSHTLIEWQAVQIGNNIQMTLFLLVILATGNLFDKTIALSTRITALVFTMLSLTSFRYASIAALLLMPYLSLRFTTLLYNSRFAGHIHTTDRQLLTDMGKKDFTVMGGVMALVAVVLVTIPYARDIFLEKPVGFDKDHYPADEAAYVLTHYPGEKFYNSYNIGGYLDTLWRGKVKLFWDGRANSLYSDDVLSDAQIFSEDHGLSPHARIIATEYKFDGLIIANNDKNASLWNANPDWKKVYEGKVATVYINNTNNGTHK